MNEHTGPVSEYRYIGPGYLNGVPARDLTAADIIEVHDREGITRDQIEASGIYEWVRWVEIKPFCGARMANGQRCRQRVPEWGDLCRQHRKSNGGNR